MEPINRISVKPINNCKSAIVKVFDNQGKLKLHQCFSTKSFLGDGSPMAIDFVNKLLNEGYTKADVQAFVIAMRAYNGISGAESKVPNAVKAAKQAETKNPATENMADILKRGLTLS